jgi:3-oxoacyl-[acyl-carrier protein] reductase
MNVRGKVAVVTGGATGIGRGVALMLADAGCDVAVGHSRSEDAARETARAIEARGVRALLARGDVAIDEDCRRIVSETLAALGRIDVLVNCAATTVFVAHKDLEALTGEAWDRIFAVNVKGAFQMTRAASAALKASTQGAVVNVSSTAASNGGGSSIPYAASKAALDTMTISLARVLAPEVRVIGVAPGFVDTRWLADGYGDRLDGMRAHVKRETPLRDAAKPELIAQVIVSAITGMDWVTGETITVDGGYLRRQ